MNKGTARPKIRRTINPNFPTEEGYYRWTEWGGEIVHIAPLEGKSKKKLFVHPSRARPIPVPVTQYIAGKFTKVENQ